MKKTEEQRGEVFDSILNLWLYIERIKKIIVDEFRGEPRLLFSCNLNYILQTNVWLRSFKLHIWTCFKQRIRDEGIL